MSRKKKAAAVVKRAGESEVTTARRGRFSAPRKTQAVLRMKGGRNVFCIAWALALCTCQTLAEPDPTGATRQKICLNGVWDFKAGDTTADRIPDSGWGPLRIPSSWIRYGPDTFTISQADAKSPYAWFRRSFFVPKTWSDGRRIKLNFQDLDWAHKVYVNGKLAHGDQQMRLCFDVDVTNLVRFGELNSLAVWVARESAQDREAGIVRSVFLRTVPPVHIEYSHALPSVQKMALTVRVHVRNEDSVKRSVGVKVAVKDNGQTALTLPVRTVEIPPGQSVVVQTSSPWKDPVLWGFGRYGQPYLYHLQTTLEGEGIADVTYDRFGFREFRTKGTLFVLNEKRFFIKGDLISRAWPFTENPSFVAAFYQGLRSANVNFQRMHSSFTTSFDSHYWYQVGDELGHLVEAQQEWHTSEQQFKDWYTAYVNQHFNHPSLVMWCPDSEGFMGWPYEVGIARVTKKRMGPWNRSISHIRRLDPTRIIDFHHGFYIFAGVKMGIFDRENFMTFNIHMSGGKLSKRIKQAKRAVDFDDSVPILIGEIFNSPATIASRGLDDPAGTLTEQRRRATAYHDNILDVAKPGGAAGAILCTLQSQGYLGFSQANEFHAGPWSDHVLVRDESEPDKPIIGYRHFMVKVRWPSLSGNGTKAEFIRPLHGLRGTGRGFGHNFNWFDSTRPMFRSNVVDRIVRLAFHKVDGKAEPALGPERAPEVIVCFGINGRPIEGAYVYLLPEEGQARPPAAVATDVDGTAWFHFWDTGRYRAVAWHEGQIFSKPFVLSQRPKLSNKPGYDHIVWVDLGGIDIERRRRELAEPAEFIEGSVVKIKKPLSEAEPVPFKTTE